MGEKERNALAWRRMGLLAWMSVGMGLIAIAMTACDADEGAYCKPVCRPDGCGDDGCGGSCGTCGPSMQCKRGTCVDIEVSLCVPDCTGKTCGGDGCGGSCGSCPTTPTWPFSGKILYEKQNINFETGELVKDDIHYGNYKMPVWGDVVEEAASGVTITLYDADGKEQLGDSVVNEDGTFDMLLKRAPVASDILYILPAWFESRKLQLAVMTEEKDVIRGTQVWSWHVKLDGYLDEDRVGIQPVVISLEDGSGAVHLFKTIRQAYHDLVAYSFVSSVDELGSTGVVWMPGQAWECGTCYRYGRLTKVYSADLKVGNVDNRMEVDGVEGNGSAWEVSTVLHEFGHFVLKTMRDNTPGGTHSIRGTVLPTLAWSEGWAHFYSMMAQSMSTGEMVTDYWRLMGENSGSITYWINFDTIALPNRGMILPGSDQSLKSSPVTMPSLDDPDGMLQNVSEGFVAWVLLQLWDGSELKDTGEEVDPFSIKTRFMWQALRSKRYMDSDLYETLDHVARSVEGTDLVDFLDALVCSERVWPGELSIWLEDRASFPYFPKVDCR